MSKAQSKLARLSTVDPARDHREDVANSPRKIELSPIGERYAWLEAMINHVPDYIYAKDLMGRFIFANGSVVSNNGFEHLEAMLGLTDADIHGCALAKEIFDVERHVMETGTAHLGVEEQAMRGGPDRWLMMSRVPLRDAEGQIIGVVGTSRDISDRKASERMVQAQTWILQKILERATLFELQSELRDALQSLSENIDVAIFRKVGDETFVVDAGEHSSWTFAGRRFLSSDADLFSALQLMTRGHDAFIAEIRSADHDLHGLIAVRREPHRWNKAINDFCLGIARLLGISIDQEKAEQQIHRLANTDHLTGLPNRAALDRHLSAMIAQGRLREANFSLGFIDLDNFKLINDSLGHGTGDALLQAIAQKLTEITGPDGYVARLGGDEFVVILHGHADIENRMQVICQNLRKPFSINGVALQVTCSAGLSQYPVDGKTIDELCAKADMAMYQAKAAGRNGVKLFSHQMAATVNEKLTRTAALRNAIGADQLVLHFQPQYELATGKITGVEALVRWHHPDHGLLSPAEFIPLAEETGLIGELGEIVLAKACAQAKLWQSEGFAPFRMGVNVSARQFEDPRFASTVAQILSATDLDPGWLEIEITESMVMRDDESSILHMKELALLGVSIALDDFGTGYSSLSSLKRFPITRLKIDRSFVVDLPNDAESAAITSAIVAMASQMGLRTIAEGVEYEAQARFLQQSGCGEAQGYHFCKPLPADALRTLLVSARSN